jgi:hypothetical protein
MFITTLASNALPYINYRIYKIDTRSSLHIHLAKIDTRS